MARILRDEILAMIEKGGDTRKDYQPERDFIVRNIVKEIRHNKELIAEIDDELRKLLPLTGYKLHTMPGIDLATEAQLISETPKAIEMMLRMYLMQNWFNLSDVGVEDAIYDSFAMRTFMHIDFLTEQVPDATTLLISDI